MVTISLVELTLLIVFSLFLLSFIVTLFLFSIFTINSEKDSQPMIVDKLLKGQILIKLKNGPRDNILNRIENDGLDTEDYVEEMLHFDLILKKFELSIKMEDDPKEMLSIFETLRSDIESFCIEVMVEHGRLSAIIYSTFSEWSQPYQFGLSELQN